MVVRHGVARCREVLMSDLLLVIVTITFFAVCMLVLRGLERL
jgi:hypothetical protein